MTLAKSRRAAQLRSAAAKLLRIANELETEIANDYPLVGSRITAKHRVWDEVNSEYILARVLETYKQRRKRKEYLPEELFGEPGWDLLLDLFAARLQNRRISVTSACIAADAPPTTALRWLGLLEQIGFVERVESGSDQRVTWVQLTDLANQKMFGYFEIYVKFIQREGEDGGDYLVENLDPVRS